MRTDLRSSILWLAPEQLLELRAARGRAITSVIGSVWLTQEGDSRDIVVRAGESFRIECDGVTLVQAVQGAAYLLVETGVVARVIAAADGSSEPLVEPAPAGARFAPDWYSLHAWARQQRAAFIGDALARAAKFAIRGLRRMALPFVHRSTKPSQPPTTAHRPDAAQRPATLHRSAPAQRPLATGRPGMAILDRA